MKKLVMAAAALAMATTAYAQTPMPLSRAVVSDEVAGRTLMKMQINATVARQLVDACLDFAKSQPNGPGTYAIFVLTPTGDVVDAKIKAALNQSPETVDMLKRVAGGG